MSGAALAVAILISFGLFGRQAYRLYRLVRAGKPSAR